ncbi:TRAP transporter large permease [Notoacmeibacter ruber]|uniref:TRAP transporter large permease protein n=1 Tax=Notoacmeibacter ruber TaxID=2670375 RepID=A0A3L7J909_9HYPH|nr:TRAP transporter large permease [Notoacmeibacter ruber]RLQ87208.1 TRAP transporter large permease [Notoacmeibacter ruber]
MILGFVFLAILLFAIVIGVPVAFALAGTTLLGLLMTGGLSSISAMSNIAWGTTSEFVLTAIPLFVLMSEIIGATGIGKDLFAAVERWLGRIGGGQAIAAIVASAVFGAVSGTAVGVAAVIGAVAVPEMLKRNYPKTVAAGSVAGASPLGMIIPPSLPLIIYGVVTETPIASLFLAGILPGILITLLCCILVSFMVRKSDKDTISASHVGRLESLVLCLPVLILVALVIGSIYLGIATPTEAAGVGAIGAFIIAGVQRRLTLQNVKAVLLSTARTSAMLLFVLMGAMLFGYLLGVTQMPQELTAFVVGMDVSPWVVFALIMIAYFVLGMFLEVTSIILITMPVIFPTVLALGFDPIWFAIVLMVNMSLAVVTPPVGLCLYVVNACSPEISLGDVIRGTAPLMAMYIVVLVALCVFPQLIVY